MSADPALVDAELSRLRREFPDLPPVVEKPKLDELIGKFSNVHLLDMERTGRFPRRLSLFGRRVCWRSNEILEWIAQRSAEREASATVRHAQARRGVQTRSARAGATAP